MPVQSEKEKKSELFKSLIIGLGALLLLVLWLKLIPSPPEMEQEERVGKKLFPAFTDPLKIGEITITRPESDYEKIRSIRIMEQDGFWKIASFFNYPAENRDQMALAVSPLLQLTVLSLTEKMVDGNDLRKINEFHQNCRLIDPEDARKDQYSGCGIHLRIKGKQNEVYADLIIGDTVPESSAVRDVRYVRLAGKDEVYIVDFAAGTVEGAAGEQIRSISDRLSTDPILWMNRDLLRISRWNIKKLFIHDYHYNKEKKGIAPRGYFELAQEPSEAIDRVWSLVRELKLNDQLKYEPTGEKECSKLDNKRINAAADALGHLQIEGVERKPEPASRIFRENRSVRDLVLQNIRLNEYGFYTADFDLLQPQKSEPCLIGENGDIVLLMKDGTSIRILFGREEEKGILVLVQAFFDLDSLKKPELLKMKEIPAKVSPDEKKKLEKENAGIKSENMLRKSEYQITVDEGSRRAAQLNLRFSDWFFRISKENYDLIKAASPVGQIGK